MPSLKEIKVLLAKTYAEWNEDQAPRLGAALAYYTVLSLAPLLILILAVAGLVFGDEAARGQLFHQISDLVGAEGAKAIEEMVQNASKPSAGVLASILGFITLVFGASSVAAELKSTLNTIWDRPPDPNESIKETAKKRSYALGIVLGCGFLLVTSLVVSSFISGAGSFVFSALPLSEPLTQIFNMLLSVLVLSGVFCVLFKYLPDVDITWRDVTLGGVFTAVLFTLGKFLIGLYLGKASFGSTYGAAGSLVIVLVWIYYSSQIFFFGAEFTQVYAGERGSDPFRLRDRQKTQAVPTQRAAQANPTSSRSAREEHPATTHLAAQATDNTATARWGGVLLGSALAAAKAIKSFRR